MTPYSLTKKYFTGLEKRQNQFFAFDNYLKINNIPKSKLRKLIGNFYSR